MESGELRCQHCGGTDFSHFQQAAGESDARWRNRCQGCGMTSDFMPTLREIRQECLRIRAEENRFEVDDDQEKFWINRAAEMRPETDKDNLIEFPEPAA